VRRRAQRGRPEDEFLRALKARGRPPVHEVAEDPPAAEEAPTPPAESAPPEPEPAVPAPEAPEEAPPGPPGAAPPDSERLLQQARDEAERRMAEARAAIERERAARVAAEREVEAARRAAQLEREEFAAIPPADGQVTQGGTNSAADALERRIEAVEESERHLRDERERWEADAERLAQRRAAELAEVELRIAQARAKLLEEQAAAQAAPEPQGAPSPPPAAPEPQGAPSPPPAAPEPQGAPSPPPAAPEPPMWPLALPAPPPHRGRLSRLRLRRASATTTCATCARELAGPPSRALASGWEVNRQGRAICDECQRQGWHFRGGADLPVRNPAGHDTGAANS
jgi:hypothetical protein